MGKDFLEHVDIVWISLADPGLTNQEESQMMFLLHGPVAQLMQYDAVIVF